MRFSKCLLASFIAIFCGCSQHVKEGKFQALHQHETKLSSSQFIVEFRAGGMTSFDKVKDYGMRKAAELTLNQGYSYFKVIKKQNISQHKKISRIDEDKMEDYVLFSTIKEGEDIIERSPGIKLTIQCYRDDPRLFNVIDAKEYLDKISK